mmetsp:Transcript_27319/g.81950  ORF Transcript_27319/g.81950 Transcript_27319/m.81950 type:complete len:276 (+) Transcript_27319:255-1082(+)
MRRAPRAALVGLLLAAAPLDARRTRFCCKKELTFNALGDPNCGRQDLVFLGTREAPREADGAAWLEFLFAVATNAAFLVPLRMLARRRRVPDVASCAGLVLTSTLYHYCDTFRVSVFGMNAGNWHRLDNVFAVVSSVALVPLLMGREGAGPTREELEGLRWTALFVGLFFQELNPWNVACTVGPILGAFAYCLWWCRTRAPPGHSARFRSRAFGTAFAAHVVSLCLFALGLDEERDAFRACHGLWHVTNAASAALYIGALDPLDSPGPVLGTKAR